ncbi:MAG: sialate O-acetylesterase [Bacteroidales bacterium]|nr:sialate O-acetylesterase [Bacteroidales bacterium]
MKKVLVLLFSMAVCLGAQGRIKLPAIISGNMVLQQKSDVKLWGWADPGEEVCISTSWSRKVYSVQAGEDGKWSIYIKTPKHCTGQTLKFLSGSGEEEITVENILIGEVWLASGQSNMEFWTTPKKGSAWMTGMEGWEEQIEDAEYPNVHLFKVGECWDHTAPHEDCQGEWVVCSKENVKNYSAVAFLFGRELHKALQHPVGVILCAVGGTHAESWIREEIMRKDSIYNRVFKNYSPEKTAPKGYLHKVPAAVWNGMVNPIAGYTIKGNIWYQAESNAWRSEDYAPIFVDLVNDWRLLWGQERLPFYFMQVAPYGSLPGGIRMEQAKVWEQKMLEDIGMTTAIDVGDSLDIHPREKLIPAQRFVALALANEYGRNVECYGPVANKVKAAGGKLVVSFKYGKGLFAGDLLPDNTISPLPQGLMIKYLYIAGADGIYHPAQSRIERGRLIAWSPSVPEPVRLKYCTPDYCKGSIYNSAGLPAYPFELSALRP